MDGWMVIREVSTSEAAQAGTACKRGILNPQNRRERSWWREGSCGRGDGVVPGSWKLWRRWRRWRRWMRFWRRFKSDAILRGKILSPVFISAPEIFARYRLKC